MKVIGVLLALLLGLSHGAWGKVLFVPGQEYTYLYDTLVTTGTEEPTGYASAYKLHGRLRVQAEDENNLAVKLEGVTVGLYNGPWTYFPTPSFSTAPAADLASLEEPFRIQLENGKFKGLIMNDQEAEWSSNMKRGLATFLQMDLSLANFEKVGLHQIQEATTMGECTTRYEVLPASTSKYGVSTISKFRNHADCGDLPTRNRFTSRTFSPCQDSQTRDLMNSTAYATYVVDNTNPDQLMVQQIVVYSSVLYWPFTNTAPYLYTWFNLTLTLANVGATSVPIEPVENPETHEDLAFVFEQNDLSDGEDEAPDFRSAEPLLFHHTAGESDPDVLQGLVYQLHQTVSSVTDSLLTGAGYEDLEKFHRASVFYIIPLISSLDFESLKQSYQRYGNEQEKGEEKATIELQLFLDGLVMSGTYPATLAVRDILLTTTDAKILARLAPSFPQYIRNPIETLATELDPIFDLTKKTSLSNGIKRIIELSMATAISKCCQKSLCTTNGLLEKYITHFEEKLRSNSFETQTVGVIGLRNLGAGRALDILLQIASGQVPVPSSVRVQAIWGLYPLAYQRREELFGTMFPVFYNRSESCEIRTSVFSFLMTCLPDERILHEIAYFMWTETCPQTSNLVRATLMNMAKSKKPCKASDSFAGTILKYLPPGVVDPTRTTNYVLDFYDDTHGFGHSTILSVQKSSKTVLPVSVYFGVKAYLGGFSGEYYGVYLRMEGIGKAISKQLANLGAANVQEIQKILSQIGVTPRESTPLKLELAIMYQHKVVAYYAADEKTLDGFRNVVKRLGELASSPVVNWQRSFLLAGVLYQQPMEIGVPISILSSIAANGIVSANVTKSGAAGVFTFNNVGRLQGNAFGLTRLTNHLPGLGTAHSVSVRRTTRAVLPRDSTFTIDMKKQGCSTSLRPPSKEDPAFLGVHAVTKTSVNGDVYTVAKDARAAELLTQSCPSCSKASVVSRGPNFRQTKEVSYTPRIIKGMKAAIGVFDCERDLSRSALLKKLKHIVDPSNQNAGIFETPASRLLLTLQQLRAALFYSPTPETCGLFAKLSSDSSGGHEALQEIVSSIKGTVAPSTPTNPELKFDVAVNVELKYPSDPVVKISSFLTAENSMTGTQNNRVQGKILISEEGNDTALTICGDVNSTMNVLPKDPLCFQDENTPHARETGSFTWGTVPSSSLNGKNTECASSLGKLWVNTEAGQSEQQLAEAQQDIFPYKNCRDQENSPLYPGEYVPSSHECFLAAVEQTNLRRVNVSISYKLAKGLTKRLRKPLGVVEGLISPYYVDEESTSDHVHGAHDHESDTESGEIEVDVNIDKEGSKADVHYHSGSGNEQHFHGIDLNLLPSFLQPSPISSRFPDLMTFGLKIGAIGICRVTPAVVSTMDSVVLPEALPACLTLLSADCEDKPRFAILGKRTSPSSLALEIHIGRHKIELSEITVRVDGQDIELPNLIQQDLPSPSSATFKALKNGKETYIISRVNGVYVRYTGSAAIIVLDSRYRGVHCGICGTWDSSPQNDLTGPDSTCRKPLSRTQFFESYVVRDGSCAGVGQVCPS